MIPRIVEHFPRYRSRVLRARLNDHFVAELCDDYDMVIAAIKDEETRLGDDASTTDTFHELVRLKRELEHELLERLATSDERDATE